ncbi:MAG: sortase [Anaerolineales bacterium]|nr:sortase [Anaerolineales bacterium]
MSGQAERHTEARIPISVVFITIGAIILLTVATIWWIDSATSTPVAALMATAVPIPTTLPATTAPEPTPGEETVALLPETPLQSEYPAHFVSALEAAVPYSGQPTQIIIPAIDLDAPIAPIGLQNIETRSGSFFQWLVPNKFEAGWHNTSARLGEIGNTVLNGHHNIYGEVFRDLVDLNEGDQIILNDPDHAYTYQVSQVMIVEERDQPIEVRQENAKWIGATGDERITLITCWPYTDNTHRVIVVAHPVDIQPEEVSDD